MTATTILLLDEASTRTELHHLTTTEIVGLALMGCAGAFVLSMVVLLLIRDIVRRNGARN